MKAFKMIIFIFAAVALAGCSFGDKPEVDNGTPEGFFLSSIDIEAGNLSTSSSAGSSSFGASAAVPHWDADNAFGVTIADGVSGTINDYPMQGQITDWSVSAVTGQTGLFRVEAITTYPYNEHIDNTREVYFLKDFGLGFDFSSDQGVKNSLHRELYSTTYAGDYSIYSRDEQIIWDSAGGGTPSTGALSHTLDFTPGVDGQFASVVTYEVRNRNDAIGSLNITGRREYSNKVVDGVIHEMIEVFETGRVGSMRWNDQIYKGNTDLTGRITLSIINGEIQIRTIEYTLEHRDMTTPLVITH